MNTLEAYTVNFLETLENVIKADLPDLPEWSRDLSETEVYATKEYTLPDFTVTGAFDGETINIRFYADVDYSKAFYAFVPVETPYSAEVGGDGTFAQMQGFRIYLPRG